VVEAALKEVRETMEAVGLEWSNIPFDISPPEVAMTAGGAGRRVGAKHSKHVRNLALAEAVLTNTSAVREGARFILAIASQL
jgi:hypothetical protein